MKRLLLIGTLAGLALAPTGSLATTLFSEDFTGQLGQGFTGPVPENTTVLSTNGNWSVTTSATQGLLVV